MQHQLHTVLVRVRLGMGVLRMIYNDVMSYQCRQAEYRLERRLRRSRDAPSSANPSDLPLHVHASGEPWVDNGELDSQPDGLDHDLNPLESSNHSS